jgi:hypothetical protein
MPNTKPVGVAYADPELVAGTTITGATIDATSLTASNVVLGASTQVQKATIATTGNADIFIIAPYDGVLSAAIFSGVDALAASDTNFITFTITNLGQAGAGSAVMLAATDANTTKTTGGTAISANARRDLILTSTAANLVVARGDRLRLRAGVTGTLANTVTFPVYVLIWATA